MPKFNNIDIPLWSILAEDRTLQIDAPALDNGVGLDRLGPHTLEEVVDTSDSIRVQFDYCLANPVIFTFTNKGGFSLGNFMCAVSLGYQHIYAAEAMSSSRMLNSGPLLNRGRTDGWYGIFGHEFGDLVLEGFHQTDSGVWELHIGS